MPHMVAYCAGAWRASPISAQVHIMKRQCVIDSFFGNKKRAVESQAVTEHEISDSEANGDSAGQNSNSDGGSGEESEPSTG